MNDRFIYIFMANGFIQSAHSTIEDVCKTVYNHVDNLDLEFATSEDEQKIINHNLKFDASYNLTPPFVDIKVTDGIDTWKLTILEMPIRFEQERS